MSHGNSAPGRLLIEHLAKADFPLVTLDAGEHRFGHPAAMLTSKARINIPNTNQLLQGFPGTDSLGLISPEPGQYVHGKPFLNIAR
ncbi:hypothetical protein D3C86_1879870 [compost metagenome]